MSTAVSSHSKYFQQEPPSLRNFNRYQNDTTLHSALRRLVPEHILTDIGKDLTTLSERISREIEEIHFNANQPHKYPILVTYDGKQLKKKN